MAWLAKSQSSGVLQKQRTRGGGEKATARDAKVIRLPRGGGAKATKRTRGGGAIELVTLAVVTAQAHAQKEIVMCQKCDDNMSVYIVMLVAMLVWWRRWHYSAADERRRQ